jgi:hypothetical protein
MIQLTNAILSLYPTASFVLHNEDYTMLEWYSTDIPRPSLEELLVEVNRLELIEKTTEYQRKRAAEYPPITDYLDAVVKGDQAQVQAYIDACLAVKAKYPKGE